MTIDLLKEILQITGRIGLNAADIPAPSTLCKAFDWSCMSVCRVLLRQSAQLHDLSEHAAIDGTLNERSAAIRHYCQRISYSVQELKVSKLVDTSLNLSLTFTVLHIVFFGEEVTRQRQRPRGRVVSDFFG